MSVDITAEVTIERPRAEVAAYMFDPRNDATWTGGLVDAKPLTDGPLVTGSKVERTSKFLGRKFSYVIEVLDHEPEARVQMLTNEPFEMRVTYLLEDAPGGHTTTRIHCAGGGSGFFKMAGPLLSRMVKRSIQNDLLMLKEALEAGL
ncbi:MAG: SRPBCC family protein [Sandaracinaceae bacterium]|nr:SRPBCC family protein [Sandaracinaceae bacterium]